MSQPVKLSDDLVLQARLVAKSAERSIAGQIEFWARLGRAIEPLLNSRKVLELKESRGGQTLSSLWSTVDHSEGRRRVSDYLARQPYPHYEVAPDKPGLLVRIDESGSRILGRFVNRQFQPLLSDGTKSKASKSRQGGRKSSANQRGRSKPKKGSSR
jgi:hypothetical protein